MSIDCFCTPQDIFTTGSSNQPTHFWADRWSASFIEEYYPIARPHQGLDGDPPFPAAERELAIGASRLVSIPVVGGLHHRYVRVAA